MFTSLFEENTAIVGSPRMQAVFSALAGHPTHTPPYVTEPKQPSRTNPQLARVRSSHLALIF